MIGIGLTLSDPNCSFTSLVILAGASGIGGGAFASSMSSISFFFPKRKQGLALGINAGFGNLGVSLTQLFIPIVCSYAAFGGSAVSEEAGVYLQNSGFLYFILLLILCTAAFFVLRTMPQHGTGSLLQNFINYCRTEFLGFLGAFTGVGLLRPSHHAAARHRKPAAELRQLLPHRVPRVPRGVHWRWPVPREPGLRERACARDHADLRARNFLLLPHARAPVLRQPEGGEGEAPQAV